MVDHQLLDHRWVHRRLDIVPEHKSQGNKGRDKNRDGPLLISNMREHREVEDLVCTLKTAEMVRDKIGIGARVGTGTGGL